MSNVPRPILHMIDALAPGLSDSVLAAWATAICFFEIKDSHSRALLERFNDRSLRVDRSMLVRMLESGSATAVASHPLLFTLHRRDFENLVFTCRTKTAGAESWDNLLFAITLHRLRFPQDSTTRLDNWVRKCSKSATGSIRSRALEGRAILTSFIRSDRLAVIAGLMGPAPKPEITASVRALFFCLQKPHYKERFTSIISDQRVIGRIMSLSRTEKSPEIRIYLAAIIRAL
jgi:hypothetical protein